MLRFIHDNLYPLWAALALVILASCWFGISPPHVTPPPSLPPEAWSLPKIAQPDIKKDLDSIKTRNLWGIVSEVSTPKPPEWRILGVARTGPERFVLLALEGKPAETLKVGDTLPDGTKIVQIDNDRFFIMTPERKKIAFGIYKNDTAK